MLALLVICGYSDPMTNNENTSQTPSLRDRIDGFMVGFEIWHRYAFLHENSFNLRLNKEHTFSANHFRNVNIGISLIAPPIPGRRKHRVHVTLPCNRKISAGRMRQHLPACAACQAQYL
jgi:hypothetical protein